MMNHHPPLHQIRKKVGSGVDEIGKRGGGTRGGHLGRRRDVGGAVDGGGGVGWEWGMGGGGDSPWKPPRMRINFLQILFSNTNATFSSRTPSLSFFLSYSAFLLPTSSQLRSILAACHPPLFSPDSSIPGLVQTHNSDLLLSIHPLWDALRK